MENVTVLEDMEVLFIKFNEKLVKYSFNKNLLKIITVKNKIFNLNEKFQILF